MSSAAHRNIKRYGTKGDYVLEYEIGGEFDSATMKKSKGHFVRIPLLAYSTGQKLDAPSKSFMLYAAVDGDFSGAIPNDSKILYNDIEYNIDNSDTQDVRGKPIYSVFMCSG